jgi:hypothetical protein
MEIDERSKQIYIPFTKFFKGRQIKARSGKISIPFTSFILIGRETERSEVPLLLVGCDERTRVRVFYSYPGS